MEGLGEVRRVHIIYLLSRMGRIEHPHLLRVHHLTRNGVYLRDVKRWLAEVRGQDFQEAFSWSYKRRYKNAYLWQDLLDDDLITPISDNEYILKGSQYHNPPGSYNGGNHLEKKTCVLRNDEAVEVIEEQPSQSQMESEILDPKVVIPLKLNASSKIGQDDSPLFNGSDTSTLTHDSTKLLELQHYTSKQTTSQQNDYNQASSSIYSNLFNNKTKDGSQQDNNKNDMEKTATSSDSSFSSSSSYISPNSSQSKTNTTYSKGPSSKPKMFRNWITCGTVDTNDAVLVTVNRPGKTTPTSNDKPTTNLPDCMAVINRDGDKLGGSCRVFASPWNNQHHQQHRARRSFDGSWSSSKKKQYEFGSPKPASDVYKPVGGPTCSQCGKSFKPEKLHAHMKSCKGMKALAKSASLSLRKTPSQRSCNSSHEESISAYFLTN